MNQLGPSRTEIVRNRRAGRHGTDPIWSAGCSPAGALHTSRCSCSSSPVSAIGKRRSREGHQPPVLQTARRGTYTESSFRATEPYYRNAISKRSTPSTPVGRTRAQARDFGHLNLLAARALDDPRLFDVIICRTVMLFNSSQEEDRGDFHRKLDRRVSCCWERPVPHEHLDRFRAPALPPRHGLPEPEGAHPRAL